MLLYYFTSLRHGLSAIRERRIKISRFNQLNDIYDHIGIFVTSPEDMEARDNLRSEVLRYEGLICMSKTYDEPLLWGHYGGNHSGMCLIFEVPHRKPWKDVEYVDRIPRLEETGFSRFNQLPHSEIVRLAHTKFTNWSYEQEVRRIITLRDYDFADDFFYQPFDEHMELRGALFGTRAEPNEYQVEALLRHDEELQFAFIKPKPARFKMMIDREKSRGLLPSDRVIRCDRLGRLYLGSQAPNE